MSVIVKGMKMPSSCQYCRIGYRHERYRDSYHYCPLLERGVYVGNREKDEDCPLVAIPENHGRISDMDEAVKCIEECEGEDATYAIGLIEWACGKRTILEAESEGK